MVDQLTFIVYVLFIYIQLYLCNQIYGHCGAMDFAIPLDDYHLFSTEL